MEVIFAVLKDLYTFAVKYRFGFVSTKPVNASVQALEAPFSPLLLTPTHDTKEATEEHTDTFDSIGYACIPEAFLYALPTRTFDGVLAHIPYGASFQIKYMQGKWLHVEYKGLAGWLHFDDVTKSIAMLQPQFVEGEEYDHNHESTIRLRTCIDDAFHAAEGRFPLQDVEYVSYRLQKRDQTILWPPIRPRVAGTWQRILKGVAGIHLGISPKKDAVMEYINADNTGHVAYIDSVYPDGSITISEVSYPREGMYHERTLPKDEWVELRPIFIEVA